LLPTQIALFARQLVSVWSNRSWWTISIIVVLLSVHVALLMISGYVHSPTGNEPGHLVAGLSHWTFADFGVFRVNPPLVRMIAALPVLFVDHVEEWTGLVDQPGFRPESALGAAFVRANGERSFWLFTVARWACVPFSVLGAIVCFSWARDLYGTRAGILACFLWTTSPTVLGHASLLTPDAHAASLGLLASYVYWKWLRLPRTSTAIWSGIALGIAQLAKTTFVILFVVWPVVLFTLCGARRLARRPDSLLRAAFTMAIILAVSLTVLNMGYAFKGTCQRLREYRFVSALLSARSDGQAFGNVFASTCWGALIVPFPTDYVLGVDLQQAEFEDFGRDSYLRGEFRSRGWWYYYLYALGVKEPVGTMLVIIVACVVRVRKWYQAKDRWNHAFDELALVAPAVAMFAFVSSQTGINHHMRYIVPSLPFLYVWISQAAACTYRAPGLMSAALLVGVVWSAASSLSCFPHNLSYFNELAGGPRNGPAHLLHSNIDWGQDLLQLKQWREMHPDAVPFYLAFDGSYDPAFVGFSDAHKVSPLFSRAGGTAGTHVGSLERFPRGWYAISVNLVYGAGATAMDGRNNEAWVSMDDLASFRGRKPTSMAGYSIYIYKLE
jgi:dolichyl-phosphate-mannose-protein mannosyltransferase